MTILLLISIFGTAYVALRFLRGVAVRRRAAQLVDSLVEPGSTLALGSFDDGRRLANWLMLAGFRDPGAVAIFLGATAGLTAFGLAAVLFLEKSGALKTMTSTLAVVPGGIGEILAAMARFGPYIIVAIFAAGPTLVVRAARRRRVAAIEQDMAATLELLATLAEAGLGFDAAVSRIQESETGERPLSQEFQIYQRDNLSGIPRLESLRKLANRTNVPSVSTFVSAMIQSEQVGASLSETLRTQADDLRDRRKLRALLLAQALPVKLVFPLMFCFLPGIFFSTLGPVLSQFVGMVDSVLRRR
jgi:tight adherence protein C